MEGPGTTCNSKKITADRPAAFPPPTVPSLPSAHLPTGHPWGVAGARSGPASCRARPPRGGTCPPSLAHHTSASSISPARRRAARAGRRHPAGGTSRQCRVFTAAELSGAGDDGRTAWYRRMRIDVCTPDGASCTEQAAFMVCDDARKTDGRPGEQMEAWAGVTTESLTPVGRYLRASRGVRTG